MMQRFILILFMFVTCSKLLGSEDKILVICFDQPGCRACNVYLNQELLKTRYNEYKIWVLVRSISRSTILDSKHFFPKFDQIRGLEECKTVLPSVYDALQAHHISEIRAFPFLVYKMDSVIHVANHDQLFTEYGTLKEGVMKEVFKMKR